MKHWRVYLCGGDESGWALDTDLAQTRTLLESHVEFTDLANAEVVHSVWWEKLGILSDAELAGKRIICHCSGEPYRYATLVDFRHARKQVGLWIAQSEQGRVQLERLGLSCMHVPYSLDLERFQPLPADEPEVIRLREEWKIPRDRFVIGNFHRDTEGHDLKSPKLVKGPDLFFEVMLELRRRQAPIHVLLAGPRRHWLRRRFAEAGIPFTYIGEQVEGDDYQANMLDHATINRLYQLIDLYMVTSRSEGGPRTLIEGLAAGAAVMSTRVGLAPELLPEAWLFEDPLAAVEAIRGFMDDREAAKQRLDEAQERVRSRHSPGVCAEAMLGVYESLEQVGPHPPTGERQAGGSRKTPGPISRIAKRLGGGNRLRVGLWHQFFKPPYGGGNQFMMCLRKGLSTRGVQVVENRMSRSLDAIVLNSIHFNVDSMTTFQEKYGVPVLHRIDGPIHLIRGTDREKDELCYDLNRRYASATILQSRWTYERIIEFGYHPVDPVIVINTVDPEVFHAQGRRAHRRGEKLRLIASSWSDNPRKGGPIYRWMEENLDWDRFEFTFVGNCSEELGRARKIDAVPSEDLAELLRDHDIYITASQNDPCSNAVLEALACGLPVLHLNDGGHPELVGLGGLPFTGQSDLLTQLDRIAEHYEMFQRLITVPSFDDVTGKYYQLLRAIAQGK